ncbi:EthD family reductase [Halobacillus rhizosphaerae]|uniref:EthD family reductase n=1 Tax=Halobacillus rhizosphaerae TaxID=3064889 RepID=UPI00398B9527
MVKLIALYEQPENEEEFNEHYFNVHTPITNEIPGLKKMEVTKITGSPQGASDYYLMCEMYYESQEDLQNGMKSDKGKASGKDLMSFAGNLVTLMIGEELNE